MLVLGHAFFPRRTTNGAKLSFLPSPLRFFCLPSNHHDSSSPFRISSQGPSLDHARSQSGILSVSLKSRGNAQSLLFYFLMARKKNATATKRTNSLIFVFPLSLSPRSLSPPPLSPQSTDTIKTKLQTQPRPAPGKAPVYSGAMDATRKVRERNELGFFSLSTFLFPTTSNNNNSSSFFSLFPPLFFSNKQTKNKTLSEQGIRGMYRGMGAPLATVALFNAVLFSVRGKMERVLAHADGSPLTVGDQAIAGAGAGVAVSFLAAPTELIKCRLQSQLTTAQAAGVSTAGVLSPCGQPLKPTVFKNVARPGVRPSTRFNAAAASAPVAGNPALAGVGGGLHGASGIVVGGAGVTSQATRGGSPSSGNSNTNNRGGRPPIAAAAVSTSATSSFAPHSASASAALNQQHLPQNYKGPVDVVKHVWRSEGGPRGLFRGLTPTLAREVPGNAVMFGVYEIAKRRLAQAQGLESTAELGTGSMIVAGGLAGTCFWIPVFPADVVKSRWQVDSPAAPRGPQFRSLLDCATQTVRGGGGGGGGLRALYRGFGPAMVRAYPANAVCFAAYEAVVRAAGSGGKEGE